MNIVDTIWQRTQPRKVNEQVGLIFFFSFFFLIYKHLGSKRTTEIKKNKEEEASQFLNTKSHEWIYWNLLALKCWLQIH